MRIKVVKSTIFKYKDVQSSNISDSNLKFSSRKGNEYEVNWVSRLQSNHYVFELKEPIKGRYNWYAFAPHVEIIDNSLSKRKVLKVPYLSQRDNKIRPHQTCNMTCAAMVIEYFYPKTVANMMPKQLEDHLTQIATDRWGRNSIYYHSRIVDILREFGVKSEFNTNTPFLDIKKSIDNNNPVIFSGRFTPSGHIIVITGYDDKTKNWIVNDPWGEWFRTGYTSKFPNGRGLSYSYNLLSSLSYTGPNNGWAHLCSKL